METFFQSEFYLLSAFPDGFEEQIECVDTWRKLALRFDVWKNGKYGCANKIPKKIHQIWIGKALPEKYRIICDSWERFNPSYEYFLWDEKAILELGDFEARKAFVKARSLGAKSDIARYEILRRYGGIYADTDFECLKPFDDLVDTCSFFIGNLYANKPYLCNAIIAAAPGHPIMNELCNKSSAINTSTELTDIIEGTGPGLVTREVIGRLDELAIGDVVFPSHYLYPYPNYAGGNMDVGDIKAKYVTGNAYAIHYWEVSWGKVDFISFVIRKGKRGIKKIKRYIKALKGMP